MGNLITYYYNDNNGFEENNNLEIVEDNRFKKDNIKYYVPSVEELLKGKNNLKPLYKSALNITLLEELRKPYVLKPVIINKILSPRDKLLSDIKFKKNTLKPIYINTFNTSNISDKLLNDIKNGKKKLKHIAPNNKYIKTKKSLKNRININNILNEHKKKLNQV